MITAKRIEQLASKKGVRRIAVESFLGSLGMANQRETLDNLSDDARSYQWNAATVNAIRTGVLESFRSPPPRMQGQL